MKNCLWLSIGLIVINRLSCILCCYAIYIVPFHEEILFFLLVATLCYCGHPKEIVMKKAEKSLIIGMASAGLLVLSYGAACAVDTFGCTYVRTLC